MEFENTDNLQEECMEIDDVIEKFGKILNINDEEIKEVQQIVQNEGMQLRSGKVIPYVKGGASCSKSGYLAVILIFIAAVVGGGAAAYCIAEQQIKELFGVTQKQVSETVKGLIEAATLSMRTKDTKYLNIMWDSLFKISTFTGFDRILGTGTKEGSIIYAILNRACENLGLVQESKTEKTMEDLINEVKLLKSKNAEIIEKTQEIVEKTQEEEAPSKKPRTTGGKKSKKSAKKYSKKSSKKSRKSRKNKH